MTQTLRCPVHHFDPFDHNYLTDPYAVYAWAHQEAPIFYSQELGYYVVTRYQDVKSILRNHEHYSSRNATDPFQVMTSAALDVFRNSRYAMQRVLLNADGATHQRIRRHVYAAFTPQRVATLEPRIQALAQQALARIKARGEHTIDIVAEFTYTLPAQVIFLLIGLPDDTVDSIKAGSESRVLFTWGKPTPEQQVTLAHSMVAFWDIAEQLVHQRLATPQDDLTSDLIRMRNDDDSILSIGEITSVIFGLLLAGHETTTGLLSNAIRRLLEVPTRWQHLAAHPHDIPAAIEELLRYDTSVIAMRRWSTQATTVGGYHIPAEANLLLLIGAANHDTDHFHDSATFAWDRPNNRDHLSFGFGSHYCIGAPLARLEVRIILTALLQMFPQARLVEPQNFDYLPNTSFRGPRSLWMHWE